MVWMIQLWFCCSTVLASLILAVAVAVAAAGAPLSSLAAAPLSNIPPNFPNDSYVDRSEFPHNFKFGTLTWALKHEAAAFEDGKSISIWDAFALQTDADGTSTVEDNTTPNDGGDQYHRYREDTKLVVDLGFDSFKLSIAWTRIIPGGRAGSAVNQAGIEFYNDVINTLLDAGIEPMVTLYEQDMPQALEESYGGLLSRLFIDDFVYFAEVCFAAFGDRVRQWVTFEEGNNFIPWGYAGKWAPPGRCSSGTLGLKPARSFNCSAGNSSTEPYVAAHHMLLAHAATAQLYRAEYRTARPLGRRGDGEIGMALWFRWLEPLTNSTRDTEASERATQFTVGWFVEPLLKGQYPQVMREILGSRLPEFTHEESVRMRGSVDFIGLNAVTAIYCLASDEDDEDHRHSAEGYWRDMYAKITAYRDGEVIGVYSGEYAVPWCMEKILDYWRHTYDNFPTYITGLGFGFNSSTNDVDRINFYSSYMKSLLVGIRNGANVLGLYVWSLIDGFETIFGLVTRFGIVYVDEQFNRHPRLSALWFKNMLAPNATYNGSSSSSTAYNTYSMR